MMEIANNTDYGLTGALISNNREHIERAHKEFHVGNLYFNRNMYRCYCWTPAIWWL